MPCEHGFSNLHAVHAASQQALRAPKPFQAKDTPLQFAPDLPIAWHELTLQVQVDVLGQAVHGTVTYEGTVRKTEVTRARFDADAIDILRVFCGDGHNRTFSHDGRTLWVELAQPAHRGDAIRLSIDFSCKNPRAGFYFILPDADHPDRPAHAWTQGQDEDSRFWFPCHDSPNHKQRVHVLATVPEGMVALSNGALRDVYAGSQAGTRIYDWQLSRPIPTYLLTLVVGPFVEVQQRQEPFPVSYWVLPGREADGERAFGRTPQMIDYYQRLLGVPFAYEKYSQVAVGEFVFGGMENASMTTQTDLTLHDERAHIDFSSEPLVSHELAHQWFGDLVTCRTWAHGWLNEGFATYFEELWREEVETADEFDYGRLQAQRTYLAEDEGRYRRSIVTRKYVEPIDVFDAHLYEKGGSVLHMLRRLLGDATFFGGLKNYLYAHADSNVETPDLRRALEAFGGIDLGRFFQQWVEEGAGHPALKVAGSWDGDTGQWQLTLEQTQDLELAPLFWLPVRVVAVLADGTQVDKSLVLHSVKQTFHIDLPSSPQLVAVDPRGDLLATWELSLPEPMLRTMVKQAPWAMTRIAAAQALGKRGGHANTAALGDALGADSSWCVAAEVAKALGKIATTQAFELLALNVHLPHAKARRSVRTALGNWQTDEAAKLLTQCLVAGDASYLVEAETAIALGRTRQPAVLDVLRGCLDRQGWNETVRCGVLDGLAALRDPQAIDQIAVFLSKEHHTLLRCAALRSLCAFVAQAPQVLDILGPWTADTSFRFAFNLASNLGNLGDGRAIALLQTVAERAVDGRVKRRAQDAIAQIGGGLAAGKQVEALRQDVDTLRNQMRDLTERLERQQPTPANLP